MSDMRLIDMKQFYLTCYYMLQVGQYQLQHMEVGPRAIVQVIPHYKLGRFQLLKHGLAELLHINQPDIGHIYADKAVGVSEHTVEASVISHLNAHVVHQVMEGVVQALVVGLHETPSILIDEMRDVHHRHYMYKILFYIHRAVFHRSLVVTRVVGILGADVILDEVVVRQPDTHLLPLIVPILSVADYR